MDFLLRGGKLIDPAQGISDQRDISVRDGRIAEIGRGLSLDRTQSVLDIAGKIVTPGLIDIHGHFYHGFTPLAVKADDVCLPSGIVAAVDAGSCGWASYRGFRDYIIPSSRVELFSFLNLSSLGLLPSAASLGEITDFRFVSEERLEECIKENPERTIGIKVRCSQRASGENPLPALTKAVRLADKLTLPVMVHLSDSKVPTPDLLRELRPGDIATHIFHGFPGHIIKEDGHVHMEAVKARERGVILDVGHGGIHFDIEVARRAITEGLWPHTLSSDAHQPPPGRLTYSLTGIISEFMAIGASLEQVIGFVTSNAASVIRKEADLGSVRPAKVANLAVFDLEEKDFHFRDNAGHEVTGRQSLRCLLTIAGGALAYSAPGFLKGGLL